MLGYILLGVSLVFYTGLFFVNLVEPRTAGGGSMGYSLAIVTFGLGFAISSLVLTVLVAKKGGFDWINGFSGLVPGLGWLFMAIATFACVVFKWEWHDGEFPQFLHWLAKNHGQVWIPLFLLVPYFYLLSPELRASVSPNMYKIPLMIGFIVSFVMNVGLLFGWFKISAQQQQAQIEYDQNRGKRLHDENLAIIARHPPTDPILNIIVLTERFQADTVRTAALAKIKEKQGWESELLEYLDDENAYTLIYAFLDGNKVDTPKKFLEPLNRNILRHADTIQKQIKNAADLQDWHFENYAIDRLLLAIDGQFLNKGLDFRPAVLKLQAALHTIPPVGFENVRLKVTPIVDDWLKRHKSPNKFGGYEK